MARVTVEDCIRKISNRFDLVLLAAQRVHEISTGAPITVEHNDDKRSVVALREIAGGTVSIDSLRESVISGFRTRLDDEPVDTDVEIAEALPEEKSWLDGQEGGNISEEIQEDMLTVIDELNSHEKDES